MTASSHVFVCPKPSGQRLLLLHTQPLNEASMFSGAIISRPYSSCLVHVSATSHGSGCPRLVTVIHGAPSYSAVPGLHFPVNDSATVLPSQSLYLLSAGGPHFRSMLATHPHGHHAASSGPVLIASDWPVVQLPYSPVPLSMASSPRPDYQHLDRSLHSLSVCYFFSLNLFLPLRDIMFHHF